MSWLAVPLASPLRGRLTSIPRTHAHARRACFSGITEVSSFEGKGCRQFDNWIEGVGLQTDHEVRMGKGRLSEVECIASYTADGLKRGQRHTTEGTCSGCDVVPPTWSYGNHGKERGAMSLARGKSQRRSAHHGIGSLKGSWTRAPRVGEWVFEDEFLHDSESRGERGTNLRCSNSILRAPPSSSEMAEMQFNMENCSSMSRMNLERNEAANEISHERLEACSTSTTKVVGEAHIDTYRSKLTQTTHAL
ncbi:hypothetical protein BJV78DRAFT_1302258 [Lactifluus subvellereus]|nr:hypothetical protein BJV78DRAFT_1302258 [Lactifluus subvellereus]